MGIDDEEWVHEIILKLISDPAANKFIFPTICDKQGDWLIEFDDGQKQSIRKKLDAGTPAEISFADPARLGASFSVVMRIHTGFGPGRTTVRMGPVKLALWFGGDIFERMHKALASPPPRDLTPLEEQYEGAGLWG